MPQTPPATLVLETHKALDDTSTTAQSRTRLAQLDDPRLTLSGCPQCGRRHKRIALSRTLGLGTSCPSCHYSDRKQLLSDYINSWKQALQEFDLEKFISSLQSNIETLIDKLPSTKDNKSIESSNNGAGFPEERGEHDELQQPPPRT